MRCKFIQNSEMTDRIEKDEDTRIFRIYYLSNVDVAMLDLLNVCYLIFWNNFALQEFAIVCLDLHNLTLTWAAQRKEFQKKIEWKSTTLEYILKA